MEIPNSIKNIKNIINDDTKTKIIGFLTILIMLWLVLYLIPDILSSLLYTLLGNLILVIMVLLISTYNIRYGLFVGLSLIILYRLVGLKEGFNLSDKSLQDFLKIENTINRNTIFDINMMKPSQEELDYFNKNGVWPWSQETVELYKESVNSNPFIRTYSGDAVNYARTKYNESSILRIMSYQTKEGQFLLNGVLVSNPSGNPNEDLPNGFGDFAHKSGLLDNRSDDIIRCNMKNSNATLERITYTGKGAIFGEQTNKVTEMDYNDLEKNIPGFTFVNGPCNPCGALNETPDYSCQFKLKTSKNSFISKLWQYLWNRSDAQV
jgi:hypothetical protein